MRFEVSEQIHTRQGRAAVLNVLCGQLGKISKVKTGGNIIVARAIEATFGSINRYDKTVFTVEQKQAGVLCIADVTYRPSFAFWFFLLLGLLACVLLFWMLIILFWIPIIFYLVQRKTVRSAIADVFVRVKNEIEITERSFGSELRDIERLAALKAKGLLTDAEFEAKKRQILENAASCWRCGVPLQADARFCKECGMAVSNSVGVAVAS